MESVEVERCGEPHPTLALTCIRTAGHGPRGRPLHRGAIAPNRDTPGLEPIVIYWPLSIALKSNGRMSPYVGSLNPWELPVRKGRPGRGSDRVDVASPAASTSEPVRSLVPLVVGVTPDGEGTEPSEGPSLVTATAAAPATLGTSAARVPPPGGGVPQECPACGCRYQVDETGEATPDYGGEDCVTDEGGDAA